ncbi:uncharacterized protein LOC118193724 [Stegodyphus dumicola]|uniref:uncharacterized protein LOC118193724 n=1 Tax=Stegodyphus dumicola TaxID=202533 RepID=UPI0015AC0ED3|nr:uncharacterized protein LOC118193724 [Stegodyphus dumicola]
MDCGLLKDNVCCEKCKIPCGLVNQKKSSNGSIWRCKMCRAEKSIRRGSWFACSKLNLQEIFFLTWELIKGTASSNIEEDFGFSSTTLADWRQFVNEQVLDYVELMSNKIGGECKVVEVDESKFGKRKYNKGHYVEGQWVFGGVERDSGKVVLVAVHERSQETLIALIKQWIEPCTTIISDCWKGYNHDVLTKEGFKHLTVNHSLNFLSKYGRSHQYNRKHLEARKNTFPNI